MRQTYLSLWVLIQVMSDKHKNKNHCSIKAHLTEPYGRAERQLFVAEKLSDRFIHNYLIPQCFFELLLSNNFNLHTDIVARCMGIRANLVMRGVGSHFGLLFVEPFQMNCHNN